MIGALLHFKPLSKGPSISLSFPFQIILINHELGFPFRSAGKHLSGAFFMIRSRKGEDYVATVEMNESDKICLKSQKKTQNHFPQCEGFANKSRSQYLDAQKDKGRFLFFFHSQE